eukprot:TRINITY_DN79503_c0_g1_i1.p1 TRINITY_DN79503_c0_g1~~TRINITY_DN79503_c0_g1_i1.p1  ORF type:complete len:326 (-),score=58.69 TRINITY_DN79503_c0_g1_i1:127-1023(-)
MAAPGNRPPINIGHVIMPQGYRTVTTASNSPVSMSTGAFPASTFPQNHLTGVPAGSQAGVPVRQVKQAAPRWSPPQAPSSDTVTQMRQAVLSTDWQQLYLDKQTKFLVSGGWSSDEQRCGLLQTLCAVSGARRVLEVGQCCGVATLAMAEVLPDDGQVVTIEIDPFLADFGKQFWARSPHGRKIQSVVGNAGDFLNDPKTREMEPFDLVVIDADKDGMWNYYCAVKEGLLAPRGAVVLDTTPYKGQPPDRYVRFGAAEKWECNSGQAAIEDALKRFKEEPGVTMSSFAGVTVLYPKGR